MDLARSLSPVDLQTVKQALAAAAEGPFFPDWEFETLIGADRAALRGAALAWPALGDDPDVAATVVNALGNLAGYPHGHDAELERAVPGGRDALSATLDRLLDAGF